MDIKRSLTKPAVKGVALSITTIIIGISVNLFTNNTDKIFWWVLLIVISLIYIGMVVFYEISESKATTQLTIDKTALEEKNKQLTENAEQMHYRVKDYEIAVQIIVDLCKECAKQTNIQIHEIIDHARIDYKVWNFSSASSVACKATYSGIIQNSRVRLANPENASPNIAVSYVKLEEDSAIGANQSRGELEVSLSGYYHPTTQSSGSLGKKQKINSIIRNKYYAKLFEEDIDQPRVLFSENDVRIAMGDPNCPYEQYIGIPVRCETINDESKLVGILQIACYKGSPLAQDKEALQYLVDHFFPVYAYLFLVLFKLDKSMRATPKKSSKGE